MRKAILAVTLAAIALPAAPALADPPPWAPAHGRRAKEQAMYDNQDNHHEPRRLTRSDRIWRGNDGRYHCYRDNGTTGLIIGAAVGGLVGNQLASGGNKTLGTILGAAGGGALGLAIDRGDLKCE
jgi:uncharacterized protein YcfJ